MDRGAGGTGQRRAHGARAGAFSRRFLFSPSRGNARGEHLRVVRLLGLENSLKCFHFVKSDSDGVWLLLSCCTEWLCHGWKCSGPWCRGNFTLGASWFQFIPITGDCLLQTLHHSKAGQHLWVHWGALRRARPLSYRVLSNPLKHTEFIKCLSTSNTPLGWQRFLFVSARVQVMRSVFSSG